MATITVNIPKPDFTMNGTDTVVGSMTWTPPTLPEGVPQWDNVVITGNWSWGGTGNVNTILMGDRLATSPFMDPFTLELNETEIQNASVKLSGSGSKKQTTGSAFTWRNLIATYTYTEPLKERIYDLEVKVGGVVKRVTEILRKVNGQMVSITPNDFNQLTQNVKVILTDFEPKNNLRYIFYKGNLCDSISGGYNFIESTLSTNHINIPHSGNIHQLETIQPIHCSKIFVDVERQDNWGDNASYNFQVGVVESDNPDRWLKRQNLASGERIVIEADCGGAKDCKLWFGAYFGDYRIHRIWVEIPDLVPEYYTDDSGNPLTNNEDDVFII